MSLRRCFLLVLLLPIFFIVHGQDYRGVVRDKETGNPQGLAYIEFQNKIVAKTDSLGYFNFSVKAHGTIQVKVRMLGYQPAMFLLDADKNAEIYISQKVIGLEELTIVGYRTKRGNNSFSYSSSDVKKIITTVGEPDVMRFVQIMPGVSQGMEGGMSSYVRGGGNGNNRVELDGVPVASASHLFGLFSTFHIDMVDKSTFQMGGISASSGDLLSSLLQIETPTPSLDDYSGSLSISPLMLGGSLSGYLLKNKLSFQVTGRTSPLRAGCLLMKKMSDGEDVGDINPQVQDLYTKLYWQVSNNSSLSAMLYGSRDYFSFSSPEEDYENINIAFGWNNRIAKISWLSKVSEKFKFETDVYYSFFNTKQRQVQSSGNKVDNKYGIFLSSEKSEWAIKSQLFYEQDKWSVNGGLDYRRQFFNPLMQSIQVSPTDRIEKTEGDYSTLATLFLENIYEKKDFYRIKGGLRYNMYASKGNLLHDAEVRLLSSLFLTPNMGIEATFDQLTQFQHSLEGMPLGWALDLLVPASAKFKPEKSNQLYLGGFWGDNKLYFTAGAYYKRLSNIVSYKSLLNQLSSNNVTWEEDAVAGRGESVGLELWLERRNSRWTGSLAYTFSKTTRQFDELNQSNSFPFKFDRPHNLNIQSQFLVFTKGRHAQRLNTSLNFTSGNTVTYPLASYQGESLPYWNTQSGGLVIPVDENYHANVRTHMSPVNGYRLPPYFRVDASYSFVWKKKTVEHELVVSVFNLLNRHNPFLIFYEDGAWKQLSLLPIVPSVRWEMRF